MTFDHSKQLFQIAEFLIPIPFHSLFSYLINSGYIKALSKLYIVFRLCTYSQNVATQYCTTIMKLLTMLSCLYC